MDTKKPHKRYEIYPVIKYSYEYRDLKEYRFFDINFYKTASLESTLKYTLEFYIEYLANLSYKYDIKGKKVYDEREYFISYEELEAIFNDILFKVKDWDIITIHNTYKYDQWSCPFDYLYYQGKLYSIKTPLSDFNDQTLVFPRIMFTFILNNKITTKSQFKRYYPWIKDRMYFKIPKEYYNIYYLERAWIPHGGFLKYDREGKVKEIKNIDYNKYKRPRFKLTDKFPLHIYKIDNLILNFGRIFDLSTIPCDG
jgi:hypothetical protein